MLTKKISVQGFTLLEILVSVLILSIGLLGLAALQGTGMQNNHSAYLRTQATLLSYDIADRMRANIAGVNAGDYNNGSATEDTDCLTVNVDTCDSASMAGHDLFEWSQSLAASLPTGVGIACIDSTPDDGTSGTPACDNSGNLYAVKIWWTDDRSSDIPTKRFTMSFQP